MYEHKFVRIELASFNKPKQDYHDVIAEHEKDGWELVQIFAPGTKSYGMSAFFEVIMKRSL
ncbi:hypothetical protein N781_16870 [Pontibacillus halophilus JSM 076056 = DSM 19796]|uniref:DUF4177 domain-containing protein n=1 Tax=Pontibacillus halophilus JSM 076056 = DSM 19796 TaxID=1385510 RepID=A0A0A5GMF7_9BACI|nr:DUF4177 domain-containing protein [Pontibacillus halophilus]KGX92408.1 hypothetical protein N781_16870 [Pontibacillus halophilus JSM 076056 = DSM 19796]